MSRSGRDRSQLARLDQMIVEITSGDAGRRDEHQAFRRAFEACVTLPCDAFVIGEPVAVIGFVCDGNDRRGLAAGWYREALEGRNSHPPHEALARLGRLLRRVEARRA